MSTTSRASPATTTSALGATSTGTLLLPTGLEDVSSYPRLIAELIGRGWTDDQLAGLTCRNVLRVMRAVESAAG